MVRGQRKRRNPEPKIPCTLSGGDVGELKRLMKRKIPDVIESYKALCHTCFGNDHRSYDCPYFQDVPRGKAIGPNFDKVCKGCGRIGEICCNKGAYVVLKRCGSCGSPGHWFWERRCTDDGDNTGLYEFLDSIEMSKTESPEVWPEDTLQNMEDDKAVASSGTKNKSKYVVVDDAEGSAQAQLEDIDEPGPTSLDLKTLKLEL